MPHIVFEATAQLAGMLDFDKLMLNIHGKLTQLGHARLDDLKSRVHVTNQALAGMDPSAQFVVARLMTTNPRPLEVQQEMAQVIHDVVCRSIEEQPRGFWWQCSVLIDTFDRAHYLKTDSHAPATRAELPEGEYPPL